MRDKPLTVGELKKFLEATDDSVEVKMEILGDHGYTRAMVDAVEDEELGVIVLTGYN